MTHSRLQNLEVYVLVPAARGTTVPAALNFLVPPSTLVTEPYSYLLNFKEIVYR